MVHSLNLLTLKINPVRKQPLKRHVWYYQHTGEEKQKIIKKGKYWYYNSPKKNGGGEVGCDTLNGAKGDLLYHGAKVWREVE